MSITNQLTRDSITNQLTRSCGMLRGAFHTPPCFRGLLEFGIAIRVNDDEVIFFWLGKPGSSPPRSLPKPLWGTIHMNCGHRRMKLAGSLGRPIAVDTGLEEFFTEPQAQEDDAVTERLLHDAVVVEEKELRGR